jgi:hypothetical protein
MMICFFHKKQIITFSSFGVAPILDSHLNT